MIWILVFEHNVRKLIIFIENREIIVLHDFINMRFELNKKMIYSTFSLKFSSSIIEKKEIVTNTQINEWSKNCYCEICVNDFLFHIWISKSLKCRKSITQKKIQFCSILQESSYTFDRLIDSLYISSHDHFDFFFLLFWYNNFFRSRESITECNIIFIYNIFDISLITDQRNEKNRSRYTRFNFTKSCSTKHMSAKVITLTFQ